MDIPVWLKVWLAVLAMRTGSAATRGLIIHELLVTIAVVVPLVWLAHGVATILG